MTNDPRDVEAAERANLEVYPTYIFKATGGADRYAILAAKYAREAAETRLGAGDLSPEELDEARKSEAWIGQGVDILGAFNRYRRLVVTGWTPPPYVDPDLLAAREIAADYWRGIDREYAGAVSAGNHDEATSLEVALAAYKAGKEAANG